MPKHPNSATVGIVNLRKRRGRRLWEARWSAHGKRHTKSLGVTNLRAAERIARDLSDLVEARDFDAVKKLFERNESTFSEVCEEFVTYMSESGEWERSTVAGYRSPAKQLVSEFGGWPIYAITPKDIEGFLAKRMDRDGLSKSTRNRYLAFLKSMYNVAVRWGYVTRSPAAELKQIKETPNRTGHLTHDERERLLAVLQEAGGLPYDVVLTLAETGLRVSSLRLLVWDNVDFVERTITVPSTKNKDPVVVSMTDCLAEHLEVMCEEARRPQVVDDTVLLPAPVGKRLLFPSPVDQTKPFDNVRKSLLKAAGKAGIGHVTPHMFRVAMTTDLVNAEVHPFDAQRVLGHRSIQTTLGYYRWNASASRKAMAKLERYRAGTDGDKGSARSGGK